MRPNKPPECEGKAWYSLLYQQDLEREARWLSITVREKVNSIDQLLADNGITVERVAEFGCGTGAVLLGCQQRGIGRSFYGVDSSLEAITFLRNRAPDFHLGVADITAQDFFFPESIDLLLLSHVVEHLEEPFGFLQSIQNIDFSYALIEVPLEDLPLLQLKNRMFGRNNSAGHVQSFTSASFLDLIRSSGFKVLDQRTYPVVLDRRGLQFLIRTEHLSLPQQVVRCAFRRYLPKYFGWFTKRFYYAHHAVLCVRG